MDRFLMRLSMEELSEAQELAMIRRFLTAEPLEELGSVCTRQEMAALQEACRKVYIHADLMKYITAVVQATRHHPKVTSGVSPRGTLAFVRASQGYAMVQGRDFVVPEDIKAVAVPVLAHRMSAAVDTLDGSAGEKIIEELLGSVQLPTEDWQAR